MCCCCAIRRAALENGEFSYEASNGMASSPRMARTDATGPQAWGTCDRCGFVGNLVDLAVAIRLARAPVGQPKILVYQPC